MEALTETVLCQSVFSVQATPSVQEELDYVLLARKDLSQTKSKQNVVNQFRKFVTLRCLIKFGSKAMFPNPEIYFMIAF